MKTFFDANVILDWILKRQPTFEDSSKALRETIKIGHLALISAASINDIHYVIRKALKDETLAREKTESLLSLFHAAKVDESVLMDAIELKGRDFEDDIVAATAMGSGADCIVTNNKKDFAQYQQFISIFTPKEYLDYLKTI